ncbi:hypothetical protein F0310_03845 [Borrelia sp. A-FGy1]|uniref:hypothetical protein n=1 Tax=Borrelia sp. A-FGy1 TaxID=2608247 RepID=UPI0015F52A12|nr:hypothetical protein [Borrelia sp. A-FGy1]QMU99518.1 hypothetical protein F0310_03845 [Borrelia sp. A-FGy1]
MLSVHFHKKKQPVKDLLNMNNILRQPNKTIKLKKITEIQSKNLSLLTEIDIISGLNEKEDSFLKKSEEILNKNLLQIGTNEYKIEIIK